MLGTEHTIIMPIGTTICRYEFDEYEYYVIVFIRTIVN